MNALTLYDVETDLQAFEECSETVTPEQRAEFEQALSAALCNAVAKRDSFAQFILATEATAAACGAEAKRLADRKKHLENMAQRARDFGARVITELGTDAKGRHRKLEGRTATLSVRKNPDSVEIVNEILVPLKYKSVTLTMNGEMFHSLMEHLRKDALLAEAVDMGAEWGAVIDKRAIKAALDSGAEVPGADIKFGAMRLEVK